MYVHAIIQASASMNRNYLLAQLEPTVNVTEQFRVYRPNSEFFRVRKNNGKIQENKGNVSL